MDGMLRRRDARGDMRYLLFFARALKVALSAVSHGHAATDDVLAAMIRRASYIFITPFASATAGDDGAMACFSSFEER